MSQGWPIPPFLQVPERSLRPAPAENLAEEDTL